MINRFFFLFSAVLLSWGSYAGIASGSFPITHTQYTPELKPASLDLDNSFQIASVCFLGSGAGCGDGGFNKGDGSYEVDTKQQCKNEGFVNACSSGYCMDHSCPYNNTYGKCLKENCPANSSTTCTGAVDGKNACGENCKKCCSTSCPAGYDYTENQLTGGSGNGWVKDGNDFCDHCTKGKLYKRKAAPVPSGYQRCDCGGANQFNSGGTYYYSSCNCCSNCSGYNLTTQIGCSYGYDSCKDKCTGKTNYKCRSCNNSCSGSTSHSGMAYYSSCYNECQGRTLYTERSCDNSCSGQSRPTCSGGTSLVTRNDECGNTCYGCQDCTEYKVYYTGCSFTGSCYFVAPSYGNSKGYYVSRCHCYYGDNPGGCSNVASGTNWEKGHSSESECWSYQSSSECSDRNGTVAATCSRCSTSWQ